MFPVLKLECRLTFRDRVCRIEGSGKIMKHVKIGSLKEIEERKTVELLRYRALVCYGLKPSATRLPSSELALLRFSTIRFWIGFSAWLREFTMLPTRWS